MRLWPLHGILPPCVSEGRTRNKLHSVHRGNHTQSSLNLRKWREYSAFWSRCMGGLLKTGHMHNGHHLASREGWGKPHNTTGVGPGRVLVKEWDSLWDKKKEEGLSPAILTISWSIPSRCHCTPLMQKWAWKPQEVQSKGKVASTGSAVDEWCLPSVPRPLPPLLLHGHWWESRSGYWSCPNSSGDKLLL